MSNVNSQRSYWETNLDPGNLGKPLSLERFDLNEELEFYFSPEQRYALDKMWGKEGLRGKRVLEIGCGMGVFALFLARQEAEVYVVDLARERLSFLRKKARLLGLSKRIHIFCATAERLPFPSIVFDIVYTKSVLIHTELNEAAHESERVLKPGGRAVFIEPMKSNPFAALYRKFLGPKEWKTITTYFDRDRLILLGRPFAKSRVRFFYLFSFLAFFWQFGWKNRRLFRFFTGAMNTLDGFLFRLIPPLRRMAWFAVVTADKRK